MTFRERMKDGTIRVTGTQVSSGGPGSWPTLEDLGLENVDNTSDLDKPISNATQLALNEKADDDEVVKLTGDQTIQGIKKFDNVVALERQTADPSPLEMADTPLLFAGNNGLPYWRDGDGVVRPIITPREAIHSNPDFEEWGGSGTSQFPIDWSRFWMSSEVETGPDETTAVSGSKSLQIYRPNGSVNTNYTTEPAYSCNPGDIVTFEFYAKCSTSAGVMRMGLISGDTPSNANHFGEGSIHATKNVNLTTTWVKYSFQWTVPPGHYYFRFTMMPWSESSSPMTFWVDDTGSSIATPMQQPLTIEDIRDVIYPVGAIFMSTSDANPAILLGGTWVPWGAGRVPVGVNTSEAEFNTVEKTGGAKKHTLTIAEMPSHNHSTNTAGDASGDLSGTGKNVRYTDNASPTLNTSNTGGGQPHNNLQPYITCYMWKRTA